MRRGEYWCQVPNLNHVWGVLMSLKHHLQHLHLNLSHVCKRDVWRCWTCRFSTTWAWMTLGYTHVLLSRKCGCAQLLYCHQLQIWVGSHTLAWCFLPEVHQPLPVMYTNVVEMCSCFVNVCWYKLDFAHCADGQKPGPHLLWLLQPHHAQDLWRRGVWALSLSVSSTSVLALRPTTLHLTTSPATHGLHGAHPYTENPVFGAKWVIVISTSFVHLKLTPVFYGVSCLKIGHLLWLEAVSVILIDGQH